MNETQKTISGRHFVNETMVMDGRSLDNCSFRDCRLVYRGGEPPKIRDCRFEACHWEFDDAAARTLQFLAGLYHGGFDGVVENTFAAIRDMAPEAPAPETPPANARMTDLARRLADFPPVRIIKRPKPKGG